MRIKFIQMNYTLILSQIKIPNYIGEKINKWSMIKSK